MRVIFLAWRDLAHPRSGGAEVLAQGLAQRLARSGHDVVFFSARVPGRPDDELVDGVRHVRRGGRYGVYRAAYDWLRRERPPYDVLIDHINTIPFFTPIYERGPVVALVPQLARDVWWYEVPMALAPLGIAAERLYHLCYRAIPAITISESSKRDLREFGWKGNIEVIAMPIPRAASPGAGTQVKSATPALVYVGRLTPSKRVEHAIAAFAVVKARFPDAELWIVGHADDGSYQRRLMEIATKVGGVQFLGKLSETARQERTRAAHVLLLTSVREGWGLVVTEANSVGTPAAGYDVPGLRDSIKPGQGILTKAGDPKALGQAVADLLADPAALATMAERAQADAMHYDWDRTYDEFVRALKTLLPALPL
ncbi:MAG TPA: glycosyltransferase family 4 protein [Candidatus Eremiobacteraceae bacterium]|nr:glycosyltransferase family 4 protein [Candidatus Eremiobacteraceae bacterium]